MSIPAFETGQIWMLEDSNLHIGIVGKTLVHYKQYKHKTKRAPISLAAITVLQEYLRRHKAVLHRDDFGQEVSGGRLPSVG